MIIQKLILAKFLSKRHCLIEKIRGNSFDNNNYIKI